MLIKVKPLGLAAYIKMNGCALIEVTADKSFVFESQKTEVEWKNQYTNSCCMRHDQHVCAMRHYLKQ